MNLTTELETQRDNSLKNAAPGFAALIERVLSELREHEKGVNAPNQGSIAPDFTLPDVRGASVRLSDALNNGPVVLAFYRGGWCPYCNLQLRAYERELPRLWALNARLIAVSPQTPDASLTTVEKNALSFVVLSDVGSHVARQYGLAFRLPDYLQETYKARNIMLPAYNGDDDWTLPIPATFVINSEGRIVLSHVDVDYRTRLDPELVIEALRTQSA